MKTRRTGYNARGIMNKQGFDFDFIVVGSGFGGSVSAMRLSEKGYNVAVLEKGKRWQQDDFPKTNWTKIIYTWRRVWALKLFLKPKSPVSDPGMTAMRYSPANRPACSILAKRIVPKPLFSAAAC